MGGGTPEYKSVLYENHDHLGTPQDLCIRWLSVLKLCGVMPRSVLLSPVPPRRLTDMDSMDDSAELGTLDHFGHILLSAIQMSSSKQALLKALDYIVLRPDATTFPPISPTFLTSFIELQFHGDLLLNRDVEEVVVHADEAATPGMGAHLSGFRAKYGHTNKGALRRVIRFTPDGATIPF